MKDNIQYNIDIVSKFFNFFNNNIDLFNKSQILSTGEAGKVQYEIDNKDKNNSSTDYIIQTMNAFIKKLMTDNTEMFNQLVKYKEIVENNQHHQQNTFQEQNIKDVKYENMLLKQQIHSLMEQIKGGGKNLNEFPDKKGIMNKTTKKKFFKKRSGSSITNSMSNNNYSNMNVSSNLNNNSNINKQKMEFEPIKRLKLKIQNLEDKIKGVEMNNDDEE